MFEFANTYCSLLRGSGEDEYGDPTDTLTVVTEHIPANLTEQTPRLLDPSTPSPRLIHDIRCLVPLWAGFLQTDRLLDESTQDVYMVMEVIRASMMAGSPDVLVLTLRRITSGGS